MDFDIIVLGAGMIGVSSAIALQQRGLRVALLDRRAPGEETSHGNAGLLERAAVVPYGFPRDLASVLRIGRNRSTDVRYQPSSLLQSTPWLWRYFRASAPHRLAAAARDMLPLISRSLDEHATLIAAANMRELCSDDGLYEAYRSEAGFAAEAANARRIAAEHGLQLQILDAAQLRAAEPGLGEGFAGAVHWRDPQRISDPGALTRGYARHFESLGGVLLQQEATALTPDGSGWQVATSGGTLRTAQVVVAMGPWSDDIFQPLGYRIPLQTKRGYHMHYQPLGPGLSYTVADVEGGFVVSPMQRGLRIATGVELARRDATPNYAQLEQAEALARGLFPLGERLDVTPWMGSRPCLPDMRPALGAAPRHRGLWFNFGHAHHGLTLGPVCGQLLAQVICGETPFTDPAPYAPARFL
ncbi:NAD(P)/FAD-dependent oxidoreductase [Vogesella indigofera]|uniref:FAD-dependent oxidoreductase n=1 Tax=Vogesella indigofera TaxID=45465 RepID=A0ABT5I4M4_VOGIN|nr:FAD-dependent oxidoreductase [Vogesella indigofera]MDC7691064.1 FAD-dependent oxidoreductase [Vogesella indigofera]